MISFSSQVMSTGTILRTFTSRMATSYARNQLLSRRIQLHDERTSTLKQKHVIHYPFASICREMSNKTESIPSFYDRYVFPEPPRLVSDEEHDTVIEKVNECMANHGRLFAVIQIASKQFKVTDHDLVRTTGYLDAEVGDRIRLEKILLVGGTDFTLVGRPIIRRSLVRVEATVVEKSPGVVKVIQRFIRTANFEKKKLYTPLHTVLRINSIEVNPQLDNCNESASS
uniref:Large ribosomal subunit protein bL21m n=1 Tax=Phallusia mammillata TaxID=59560 RepID=A0A6F9DLV3_9ASCI|nr:39S ribosomal protein L21, mitochondrial isoform 2 [Phallusia mammillata]